MIYFPKGEKHSLKALSKIRYFVIQDKKTATHTVNKKGEIET